MNLSEHFTLSEFERSGVAARLGIDNSVPEDFIQNGKDLCVNALEPIREHFGPVAITSGFRCLELNQRLGSKPTSHHTKMAAADLVVFGTPCYDVAKWAETNIQYTQLILEGVDEKNPLGSWVHVAYVADRLVGETLTWDRKTYHPAIRNLEELPK